MNRLSLVPAAIVLGLGFSAPAGAQISARPDWNYADEARQPYYESRQLAYDNGYREGLREGEHDARRRESFNFQDERTFQRAEKGFNRSFGDFGRYQQSFRTGFASGYQEAYRRFSPGYGSGGGYYGNGNRGPAYPNRGSGGWGGGYGYRGSPAYANGVRDGYEKGREDARDRDSYYPLRHKWYRAGDHDYKREYGPRQDYENVYREGFKEGYDRGYREGTYRR